MNDDKFEKHLIHYRRYVVARCEVKQSFVVNSKGNEFEYLFVYGLEEKRLGKFPQKKKKLK